VDGPESSLLQLVDRLALEILRIVLERGEEELPKIDLASITTESPEALRAYLEGEVSFRHFDLQAAVEAFQRAVEADSMFALAHYRLADTYMWPTVEAGNSEYHLERAVELSDRLPAEEKVLVKALLAHEQQSPEAIESLRELVEKHPENPEAWYLLADTYLHVTGGFATAEEIGGMFARAVQLDSKNAKYLLHHVQFAWWYEPDSSMAAKRLEVFEQVAPRHPLGPAGHYAVALAFGNPANQLAASSRLRQEEDPEVVDDVMRLLFHPRYIARPYVLEQRLRFSDDPRIFVGVAGRTHVDLFWNYAMWHGQLRRGLSHLEQLDSAYDAWRAELLYTGNLAGLPISQETLQGFASIDSTAENWQLNWGGVLAADNGRWSDHSRAIVEFRRRKQRALEASDSLTAEWRESAVLALEAHGSWRKGNLADALPIFSDAPRFLGGGQFARWRLARVYQGLGRLKDAEQVYNSFHFQDAMAVEPLSQFQLGKIYEALNEYEKAIQSYDYFVEYWKDADAELQPMVEDARRAVIRLRGPRRE
jgi:tetratricopeptide (TPR) repeat protein